MPRSRPEGTKFPAFSGGFLIDDFRGQQRARKWPRKRGRPKSQLVREQNDWFKAVTQIIKLAAPDQTIAAMDATKGQGVYPRDLLMHAISEGIMDIIEVDGTFVQHRRPRVDGVAFQGFRLGNIALITLSANVSTVIPWDTPILDTAAFWNVATPHLITIPIGVTVMAIGCGWNTDSANGAFMEATIREGLPANKARNIHTTNFRHTGTLTTGPMPVIAGETYEITLRPTANTVLRNNFAVGFWGEILGTT